MIPSIASDVLIFSKETSGILKTISSFSKAGSDRPSSPSTYIDTPFIKVFDKDENLSINDVGILNSTRLEPLVKIHLVETHP